MGEVGGKGRRSICRHLFTRLEIDFMRFHIEFHMKWLSKQIQSSGELGGKHVKVSPVCAVIMIYVKLIARTPPRECVWERESTKQSSIEIDLKKRKSKKKSRKKESWRVGGRRLQNGN